jgi:hypothetical protein
VCCAWHLAEDGPTGPKYLAAAQAVAAAKARLLKKAMG